MKICPVCKKEMANEKYVYIHIIKWSKKDNPHKNFLDQQNELIKRCSNLNDIINNPNFYLHIDYAKKYLQSCGIGKFKCEVCSEAFLSYQGIQAHFKQKNIEQYFDKSHNDFYNKRKETVIGLIKQNKTITEIVRETNMPIRLIKELASENTNINCSFCAKNFINQNSLLNHIKLQHPEYIESIKKVVIEEYYSELSIEKIIEKYHLFIGKNSLISIWKKNINNCNVAKRGNDIAAVTNKQLFETGQRKIWCEGLDTSSSEILNRAAFKISQYKLSKNKEKGIDQGEMETIDIIYFNRMKKKFIKNLYNCQKCNVHYSRRRLHTHHIIPFRLSKCNFISNFALLCSVCHSIFHERCQKLEKKEMNIYEKFQLYMDEHNKYLLEPIEKDSGIENPEFYDKQEQKIERRKESSKKYYYLHKDDPEYKINMHERQIRFRKNNPEKQRQYVKDYRKRKQEEDPELWKQKRKEQRERSKSNKLEKDKI